MCAIYLHYWINQYTKSLGMTQHMPSTILGPQGAIAAHLVAQREQDKRK